MNRARRDASGWLILVTAPVWLFPLAWVLAFSPYRLVSWIGHILIQAELLSVPGLFVAAAVLVAGPVLLVTRRDRLRVLINMGLAVLFAASFAAGLTWRFGIWRESLARVAERGQPLVDAITAYEAKNGRPPRSLDDLVPDYLDRIPTTGIGAHPDFHYVVGRSKSFDGNDWVLTVTPPCLAMGFDTFMYFPRQNYPDRGYGGSLERIGTWAYVHE